METVVINVSKTPCGYSASCDLLDGFIVAYDGDFDDFELYLRESIDFYINCAKKDGENYHKTFETEYIISYKFDIQSLLCHYQNIFSLAALQYITGINQRQLWHYAAGRYKPRKAQAEKIILSLNKLGRELTTLTL